MINQTTILNKLINQKFYMHQFIFANQYQIYYNRVHVGHLEYQETALVLNLSKTHTIFYSDPDYQIKLDNALEERICHLDPHNEL